MARDDGEQQAMSEARLAAIRQRVECTDEPVIYWNGMSGALEQAEEDRAALLAEVERRKAREAALIERLLLVLEDAEVFGWQSESIEQARALLASADSERSGE